MLNPKVDISFHCWGTEKFLRVIPEGDKEGATNNVISCRKTVYSDWNIQLFEKKKKKTPHILLCFFKLFSKLKPLPKKNIPNLNT